jgi:TetR/AcrR family transcriptional regulator
MKEYSRKEREWIARKELIVDAAEAVISQRGFDSATMEEIADRAELGKGTLYLHFKSKVAIYLAICERGSTKLNRKFSQVFTGKMTGLEMIKKIGVIYLEFIRKNPLYFNAFNYYETILDEEKFAQSQVAKECEENAREAMTYIVRALQIGMQDGSIKDSFDPMQLGLMIWSASKGVMHMAFMSQQRRHHILLDGVELNVESLVENFIHLIQEGIKK